MTRIASAESGDHASGNLGAKRSDYSRFAARIRRRYAEQLPLLSPGSVDGPAIAALFAALSGQGLDLPSALRVTRQLVLERLLSQDCDEGAGLKDITAAMTHLAEFALDTAVRHARTTLDTLHGMPLAPDGQAASFCVVGMGKLGARELNVSSDIDLIYVYDHNGNTAGNAQGLRRLSNPEYFAKCVKYIHALIGETTEHGFVFRVDLALRPNGNSGPSAVSIGALEEYFQVQGREWERFAWLKSRVIAPFDVLHGALPLALRDVVLPFVFRRYLDYKVFDSLRELHQQIRDHATKRNAGRPERTNDVKLSRGGIREIEFTVQLLQVVRAGQFPELRTRPTLAALQRLAHAGLVSAATADALAQAYVFLRQVEHRIQYLDDQQTHVLPVLDADLAWIAHTMGLADSAELLGLLDGHRERVAQEFDTLLGGSPGQCKTGGCNKPANDANATPDFDDLLAQLPEQFRQRVSAWQQHPRVVSLKDDSRRRLLRLLARTALWLQEGRTTEAAAVRLADWMEPLLRRESYLAMLVERPLVHERLLRLLGAAKWPARYLMTHPGVIDELASSELLDGRFAPADFERDLEQRRAALQGTAQDGDEALLDVLRRAHHAEVFRTLARDVEGRLTVEQVADDLSALADCVLRLTTRWCWQRLKTRHREAPQLAIIAYGKLGGKELSYGSDLDIVFVFQDDDERASEIYAALVRKLINWLTVKTGEGDLYEIDTALRPNGGSGLLVTSFDAFASYQQQRGSNTAWTWEHQAMTRARFVLGNPVLQQRFDAIRQAVLVSPRDAVALRLEIAAMRQKLHAAYPAKAGQFDVKQGAGGMLDVEFAVQCLVLSHACTHPGLIANAGNIALLEYAQSVGLLPDGIGHHAADAYRTLRRVQHQARLNEEPTQVPIASLAGERAAVLALWGVVFGGCGGKQLI